MTQGLMQFYQAVRHKTEELCNPLQIEDYVIQSIEDTSPPKWHLAHTTWFFETFVLIPHLKSYKTFNKHFNSLFNSYYLTVNQPYPRAKRGLLSRPTVQTIYEYRNHVDSHLLELLRADNEKIESLVALGLHHEQQHQELLMMDIKHNFYQDKSFPVYKNKPKDKKIASASEKKLMPMEAGLIEIGHPDKSVFCFDNELPRHQLMLKPYCLDSRLVTNEEFLEFIDAGGYQDPSLWLSDGWDYVQRYHWQAPLYWEKVNDDWSVFTLSGLHTVQLDEPVVHVSFFEADAYARWRGQRLPLESEWEHFVVRHRSDIQEGNFLESKHYHPSSGPSQQFYGDVWEWTASAYSPYPGYKPLSGALGEYNGKFMSNQMVLKGGSCVTPKSHIRASYRNFFQPEKRWQFSGIRLASDME